MMNGPIRNETQPTCNSAGSPSAERVLGLLVALLAIVAYLPALANGFVDWDDPVYVTANSHVAAGITPSSVYYAWTTFDSNNWIPLTWMSYELDASLFGVNPLAFHAVNVFWHAVNVWLLFHVLKCFTGMASRSAAVAALFAVHPMHVESVAWVSERKDLLSTCALLLTLLAYQRHADRPTIARYVVVCGLMALGLLAKSMLVTLPILLCLVDVWPLQRLRFSGDADATGSMASVSPWKLLLEKLPLFLLALVDGIITMAAQRSAMTGSQILPLSRRLGNASLATCWYVWKTLWPTALSPFYQHPRESLSGVLVVASIVMLVVVTALVILRGGRHKNRVFGWLWFLIALLPILGLIQVGTQAYADRYAYVPHIGLFTLIVWEVDSILQQWRGGRRIGIALMTFTIGTCTVLTHWQIGVWRDSKSLWNRAIVLDQYNPIAHLQLGRIAAEKKDWDSALQHYSNVMVYRPSDPDAILNLAAIHQQRQEWDLAADYYLWLLRLNPRHGTAARNLASLPRRSDAAPLKTSAAANEKSKQGLRLARQGNIGAALQFFQEAADLDPQDVSSQNYAATALEELNRPDDARIYYERALQAKPGDVEAKHGIDRIEKRLASR